MNATADEATDFRAALASLRDLHLRPEIALEEAPAPQRLAPYALALSAEAHASMAVLCHRTGDKPRAMHHAREALAEQPDDETVRELLRMLDEDA